MKSIVSFVVGTIAIVAIVFMVFGVCDKIDQYTMEADVSFWCDKSCTFELSNGEEYVWEFDTVEEAMEVGSASTGMPWLVTLKDYEDGDPKNDTIVSFKHK